ncbi:MAG: hypothetical protein QGG17_00100 [Rhodospirillales bacterium]|jgi:hypothetical protein|nr:hypothetical protein [Rhodospirillales bacterium]MDP6805823.1 hypothetical protein [Rhodospirillales bacterium]
MTIPTEGPSKRYQELRERLDRAVELLEAASARPERIGDHASDDADGKEIAALRAENDRLRETSGAVSGRLDSAITRLKSVLEG